MGGGGVFFCGLGPSPLFELSETAVSFGMVMGAITGLFMGFRGIVQTDINGVIAYWTLSQWGI